MTNYIDRVFQRKLLEKLADKYPNFCNVEELLKDDVQDISDRTITNNLEYLRAHKLVEVKWGGPLVRVGSTTTVIKVNLPTAAKITAAGLDFLADDGGLTAILGVVTVKLHEDTLKELMIAKIQSSDANPTVKKNLIETLKKLPADAMKELSMAAVRRGIDSLPDAVQWFQTLLHSL